MNIFALTLNYPNQVAQVPNTVTKSNGINVVENLNFYLKRASLERVKDDSEIS